MIDIVDEILILFENVFEIYGDIRGASNSFKINAYEQGKNRQSCPGWYAEIFFARYSKSCAQ